MKAFVRGFAKGDVFVKRLPYCVLMVRTSLATDVGVQGATEGNEYC